MSKRSLRKIYYWSKSRIKPSLLLLLTGNLVLLSCIKELEKSPTSTAKQVSQNQALSSYYNFSRAGLKLSNTVELSELLEVGLDENSPILETVEESFALDASVQKLVVTQDNSGNLHLIILQAPAIEGKGTFTISAKFRTDINDLDFHLSILKNSSSASKQFYIFIQGENLNGVEQTGYFLELVRQSPSSFTIEENYKISSAGSIGFAEIEGSYQIETRTLIAENLLAVKVYSWSPNSHRFYLASSLNVQDPTNGDERLRGLYSNRKSDFLDIIAGTWYLANRDIASDEMENYENTISIELDFDTNKILLFNENVIEELDIQRTFRNIGTSMTIIANNTYIDGINRALNIEVYDYETMSFTVALENSYNNISPFRGRYKRIRSKLNLYIQDDNNALQDAAIEVRDTYSNDSASYSFTDDYLLLENETGTYKGSYSIFMYSAHNILEYELQEQNSLEKIKANFIINLYAEETKKTLTLEPVELHLSKLVYPSSKNERIVLEQNQPASLS